VSLIDEGLACTKEVAMAKALMSEVYLRCTHFGVRVHGGIGTTRDHDMGLYYRRARQAACLFGDAEFWREKVACELGL
jgi:alkylation response protein AidB-like acyl-CoA dehydrogenase